MTKGLRSLSAILVLFLAAANGVGAWYVKFDGVYGTEMPAGRPGWIEVESFQWAVDPSGKLSPESKKLNFTIRGGTKSAEELMKAARAGRRFPKVRFDTGKQVYEMQDAAVIWIGKGGSTERPTESLSLNYTKVEYKN